MTVNRRDFIVSWALAAGFTALRPSALFGQQPAANAPKVVEVDKLADNLFVMAAGSLRYGDIVGVIDAARGAGVTRVGIVTDRMRGLNP